MKNLNSKKTLAALFVVLFSAFAAAAQMPANAEQQFVAKALEMLQKENFAEAEKAARQAIKANPKSGEGYGFLGVALGMQGREEEGKAAIRKALELLPKDSIWRERFAELMTEDEDEAVAEKSDANAKTENAGAPREKDSPKVGAAAPQAGLWRAKITNIGREETITFRVSANGKQIEDVVFDGYWRCDDASSSFRKGLLKKVDVNSPPGTFAINGGAFSDVKKEPYLAWTFEGAFTGATAAKGFFRIEYATECDTYKLEWTAQRVGN